MTSGQRNLPAKARATNANAMSVRRFLHYLAIAALLLMPLGMTGGKAMAIVHSAPAAAAMDHCGGANKSSHHSAPDVDCMAACAAIPAAGNGDIAAPIPFPAAIEPSPVVSLGKGLGPEAAIPPPRFS